MVTGLDEGSAVGAVYFPVESMVPRVAEPLAVSLTNQETAVLLEPVTVDEKVKESPARMLAVVGATETATVLAAGGSGAGDFGVEEPPPLVAQPARSGNRQRSWRSRGRILDKFGSSGSKGQLYEGTERGQRCGGRVNGD